MAAQHERGPGLSALYSHHYMRFLLVVLIQRTRYMGTASLSVITVPRPFRYHDVNRRCRNISLPEYISGAIFHAELTMPEYETVLSHTHHSRIAEADERRETESGHGIPLPLTEAYQDSGRSKDVR